MNSLELADRWVKALEEGDIDAARDIYHPDAIVWRNFDGLDQRETGIRLDESLKVLPIMPKIVKGLRYDVWYREATASGFVQQHVYRGTLPNGDEVAIPICSICTVVDGRITRIDEYIDSSLIGTVFQSVGEALQNHGMELDNEGKLS